MLPRRRILGVWAALSLTACSAPIGHVPALLGPEAYPAAMVLATGIEGEDCGTWVLFVRVRQPALDHALARALATVPEATLLTDVDVEETRVTTGIVSRCCLKVRGSAAKLVSTFLLPAPASHSGHHGTSP